MTGNDDIRAAVLRALAAVAPEADGAGLDPRAPLRDQLDLDSMDMLNLAIGIGEELGVEIPEADYRRLDTLDACVEYLAAATAGHHLGRHVPTVGDASCVREA